MPQMEPAGRHFDELFVEYPRSLPTRFIASRGGQSLRRSAGDSNPIAEFLDLGQVRPLAREHVQGRADRTGILYTFFALEQWLGKWLPS